MAILGWVIVSIFCAACVWVRRGVLASTWRRFRAPQPDVENGVKKEEENWEEEGYGVTPSASRVDDAGDDNDAGNDDDAEKGPSEGGDQGGSKVKKNLGKGTKGGAKANDAAEKSTSTLLDKDNDLIVISDDVRTPGFESEYELGESSQSPNPPNEKRVTRSTK